MPVPTDRRQSRNLDAFRFLGAGLVVVATLLPVLALLTHDLRRPFSTHVDFVDDPAGWPAADPAELAGRPFPTGPIVRLGFVGDIMQHRGQAEDDFQASYADVRPIIESFDLSIGNLEFPVHSDRPVGPPNRSVRFNGSLDHLDSLATAGFDVLSTSNNHSFDQGLDGLTATLEALEARGIVGVGARQERDPDALEIVEVNGLRIGFAAYTILPNSYEDEEGEIDYWSAAWPIHELNFADWSAEYRAEGTALFAAHARRSAAEDVEFLVALVHWGDEWHFQPTADQRLAAHDMIDAGFDLVVGGHSHVLNPPELYRGRLIAYSLGNFISDFVELEARTGAILEVSVGTTGPDELGVVDFAYYPVLTAREGHLITPLGHDLHGDQIEAWQLAQRIIGNAVTQFDGESRRISEIDRPTVEVVQTGTQHAID